jgi:hypothetical protein
MFNGNINNKVDAILGDTKHADCKKNKIINNDIDLCKIYIDGIKNMKTLDNEMINNVRNMSNEEKMNIIIMFNNMIDHIKEILEQS